MAEHLPLVSFCIKSYNHSAYVREALAGAFAQTYRPLEIVIVDDNSTDSSAKIIDDEIRKYKESGGDAVVVFERNKRNLGNMGNWLRLCELAKGELLIKADGDDVSVPRRTAVIVDAWLKSGKRAIVVSHRGWNITSTGHRFGLFRLVSRDMPLGTAMAWRPECWSAFRNDIDGFRYYDDDVFARRARMLDGYITADGLRLQGEIVLDEPLIEYRIGTGVSTEMFNYRRPQIRCRQKILTGLELARSELEQARNWLHEKNVKRILRDFEQERKNSEGWLKLLAGKTIGERMSGYRHVKVGPWWSPMKIQQWLCVWPPIFVDWVLSVYLFLNYWRKRIVG